MLLPLLMNLGMLGSASTGVGIKRVRRHTVTFVPERDARTFTARAEERVAFADHAQTRYAPAPQAVLLPTAPVLIRRPGRWRAVASVGLELDASVKTRFKSRARAVRDDADLLELQKFEMD